MNQQMLWIINWQNENKNRNWCMFGKRGSYFCCWSSTKSKSNYWLIRKLYYTKSEIQLYDGFLIIRNGSKRISFISRHLLVSSLRFNTDNEWQNQILEPICSRQSSNQYFLGAIEFVWYEKNLIETCFDQLYKLISHDQSLNPSKLTSRNLIHLHIRLNCLQKPNFFKNSVKYWFKELSSFKIDQNTKIWTAKSNRILVFF